MATTEICPDCGRPLGELPPLYRLGQCVGRKGSTHRLDCLERTISRLKAELATVEKLVAIRVVHEVLASRGTWENRLAAVAKKYQGASADD